MKKGQLPGWLSSKEPTASAGDKGDGFDPGLGSPGERNGRGMTAWLTLGAQKEK